MMRILITSAAFAVAATTASAQMPGAAAKAAAQKAVAATNAQIAAEQAPTRDQSSPKATTTSKVAAVGTKTAGAVAKPGTPAPDTAGPPSMISREEFDYSADRRRDPFNSLLNTNELRPTMSDLKITGILFDPSGRRSFATLRDLTNNSQYRVTTGTTLGRMRVAAIRTRIVVFTIDEFGTTRQDSLVFGDTTKARVK